MWVPQSRIQEVYALLSQSSYCRYAKKEPYKTLFPIVKDLALHLNLMPNQAKEKNKRVTVIALEVLTLSRGPKEKIKIAHIEGTDTRVAYLGKTEAMRTTLKALNLPPFGKNMSHGEYPFRCFARELEQIKEEEAHFEYELGTGAEKSVWYALRRVLSVYQAQDSLLRVLRKIHEVRQDRNQNSLAV